MTSKIIRKSEKSFATSNMQDYEEVYGSFAWEEARARLDGFDNGCLNIAHECVDRHVAQGRGERVAIRWVGKDDTTKDLTYRDLRDLTNRFANIIAKHGAQRGDSLFCMMGRLPEVYVSALGSMKAGLTFSPLFAAFGPDPIRSRMEIGKATVLVTTEALYNRKIKSWRSEVPSLKLVLLVNCKGTPPDGCLSLDQEMEAASDTFETVHTKLEDKALIHFTSGTTGKPKGAVHVHGAIIAHAETGRIALDMQDGDVFWCTADPGWVTGTSYGIISPLANGLTLIVDEAEFNAKRWYRLLETQKVNIWYTAPTAIRMLMAAGRDLAADHDFSDLRFMSSVGEPLNAEAVIWGEDVFGHPFHDNWWQTETGGIMLANYASMDVKPGSMGKPLPGIVASIVEKDPSGKIVELTEPMKIGELALRSGWPSMMRAYLDEEARYNKCFVEGWYLTDDLAKRDADGYYWFVGRADDLIKSSGHLIGPFEVESAIIEHPAVSEVAVIGLPDPQAGEIVKAYVALNPGQTPDEALELDIRAHARKRLGPAVAPRQIVFRKSLPKTRSGKIMRRLLKARELGLPEGDISTLESDEA
ncbi:MAG: acetate--CoA ligase [Henriciella sp.]|nr:acetate--CoA ligase [Henriciella sp.]